MFIALCWVFTMDEVQERYQERREEIEAYLDFLDAIEDIVRSGVPRLGNPTGRAVTPQQQKILYAGVYLQLYNLVEATINGSLQAVTSAAGRSARWYAGDLTVELRREWVRHVAKTSIELGADKRLEQAIVLCDHLIATLPVSAFDIEKGGGGNWDDVRIHKVATRIGCRLSAHKRSITDVKRIFRNDLGAMALIVSLRNKLAHGSISFAECGQDDSVAGLRDLSTRVFAYLEEILQTFVKFINEYRFLRPESRPAAEMVIA
jgi:MAE_28990/MAE_18760-like HEPN